jgi:hypothetical protein
MLSAPPIRCFCQKLLRGTESLGMPITGKQFWRGIMLGLKKALRLTALTFFNLKFLPSDAQQNKTFVPD